MYEIKDLSEEMPLRLYLLLISGPRLTGWLSSLKKSVTSITTLLESFPYALISKAAAIGSTFEFLTAWAIGWVESGATLTIVITRKKTLSEGPFSQRMVCSFTFSPP